ncbi:MAG: hypothetical protein II825_03465 [Paludibacteraceae bacterium]|nr:hypothetical protein [Paludibacteraceae bacterium]
MTIQEFQKLTGIQPEQAYFDMVIHPAYMAAGDDVTKEQFCKRWMKDGSLNEMIQSLIRRRNHDAEVKDARIAQLERSLEYHKDREKEIIAMAKETEAKLSDVVKTAELYLL